MRGLARLVFPIVFVAATTGADNVAHAEPAPGTVQKSDPCRTAVPPTRSGVRIRNESQLIGFTITAAAEALDNGKHSPAPHWCMERTVTIGERVFFLWHNVAVDAPGVSGPFDRVTTQQSDSSSGVGNITLIVDALAHFTQPKETPSPPVVYHALLESEDTIEVLASFDAPPPPEELCRFAMGGYIGINATIEKKTKKVNIFAPQ